MAKSPFRQALEAAIQQRHSKVHPWSDAWVSGRLDRRLLGEWTKQHFHYVSHFSEWLATVFGNCPDDDVRHFFGRQRLAQAARQLEQLLDVHPSANVRPRVAAFVDDASRWLRDRWRR